MAQGTPARPKTEDPANDPSRTGRYLFEDRWAALHERGVELLKEVTAWVGECRDVYEQFEPTAGQVLASEPFDVDGWYKLSVASGLDETDRVIRCMRECIALDPEANDSINEDWLAEIAEKYGVTEHLGERCNLRRTYR